MNTDTPPPHDPLTEASALGTIMDGNGEAPQLLAQLTIDDFYDARHRITLSTLQALHQNSDPLNCASAYIYLQKRNALEAAGGLEYITALPDQSPGPATFPLLLDTLHSFTARRAALRDAGELTALAKDPAITGPSLHTATQRLLESHSRHAPAALPAMLDAATFATEPLTKPLELVHGLLHQGSKLALGGGSKSFKSWSLLDLALSVAYGLPWLNLETTCAPVLYINFEIPPWSWQHRLNTIALARAITQTPTRLTLWNLRGYACDFNTLLPKIIATAKSRFALIIIDPIYKLYGRADENSASDIAALLNAIDTISTQTSAAVAWGAHFSKGNQSAKESIDRISGSGVFARDPDSLIIFTKHEVDDAFTVESTLRNFPPLPPFVVKWDYPRLTRTDDLDPARLKKLPGRPQLVSQDTLLDTLPTSPTATKDWLELAKNEAGISERSFYRLKAELCHNNKILLSKINGCWIRT